MILAFAGAAFTVACAFLARWQLRPGRSAPFQALAPVTVLRPLHGAPPGLEEALASSLEQDYPAPIQLVCGVQSQADPACDVVKALQRRFPDHDIVLVIDPHLHGANRKISNLINMMSAARHDLLVVADADIVAPRNWLSAIAQSLSESRVGGASCFYVGNGEGRWPRLSAMGISYQFLPAAAFGTALRLARPCFGATIALTRERLREIGGFQAFSNCLADDYEIGRALRRTGYSIEYPKVLVRHLCVEKSGRALWAQESRWARTVRTVNPLGHLGSLLTHAFPFSLLAAALLDFSPEALAGIGVVLAARLLLKAEIDDIAGLRSGPAWLLPFRDLLSFAVFAVSLVGRVTVNWRGDRFRIGKDGAMSQVSG
jgi:ceramide glucosyltransferase